MDEVTISDEEFEKLRQAILTNDPEPIGFYPVMLVQLATKGPVHNHGPIAIEKTVPAISSIQPDEKIDIYRFYVDGLIVHLKRRHLSQAGVQAMGKVVLGSTNELGFLTIDYENSFQAENLRRMQQETEAEHPTILDKLAWPPVKA